MSGVSGTPANTMSGQKNSQIMVSPLRNSHGRETRKRISKPGWVTLSASPSRILEGEMIFGALIPETCRRDT